MMSVEEYERRGLERRRRRRQRDRLSAGSVVVMVAGAMLYAYIILAAVWGMMR